MRTATACLLIASSALMAEAGLAQHVPENEGFNNHRFFSTPAVFQGSQKLFYLACNLSTKESAFRWQGAGFGVDAFAQLEPDNCAFKNRYTPQEIDVIPHKVSFQGGLSSQVRTWVPCYAILGSDESTCQDSLATYAYAAYSAVEAMVTGPDGTVALSAISIMVDIHTGSEATIIIEASDIFQKLVIALPSASVDIEEVRQAIDTTVAPPNMSIDEFDRVRADPAQASDVLTSDVPAETPSIAIPKGEGDDGISVKLSISDLSKLGTVIVLYGEVGGQISLRNDIVAEPQG